MGCIFLACDKAITVEFKKQNADYEAGSLVAIDERVIADNSCRIGRCHIDDAGCLRISGYLPRPRKRGLQQRYIPNPRRAAMQRQQAIMQRQSVLLFALGMAFGLPGYVAVQRLLGNTMPSMPFPGFWLGAVILAVLGLATLAASFLPAHRAARTDPLIALRAD